MRTDSARKSCVVRMIFRLCLAFFIFRYFAVSLQKYEFFLKYARTKQKIMIVEVFLEELKELRGFSGVKGVKELKELRQMS